MKKGKEATQLKSPTHTVLQVLDLQNTDRFNQVLLREGLSELQQPWTRQMKKEPRP